MKAHVCLDCGVHFDETHTCATPGRFTVILKPRGDGREIVALSAALDRMSPTANAIGIPMRRGPDLAARVIAADAHAMRAAWTRRVLAPTIDNGTSGWRNQTEDMGATDYPRLSLSIPLRHTRSPFVVGYEGLRMAHAWHAPLDTAPFRVPLVTRIVLSQPDLVTK